MVQQVEFYTQQAEKCGAAASGATLANEREKFLQAQAAWQALADSTTKIRDDAAKRDATRAAIAAAEAEAEAEAEEV